MSAETTNPITPSATPASQPSESAASPSLANDVAAPVPSLAEILASLDAKEEGEPITPTAETSTTTTRESESVQTTNTPSPLGFLSRFPARFDLFPLSMNTLLKIPVALGALLIVSLYLFNRHWFLVLVWTLGIALVVLALAGLIGRGLVSRFKRARFWRLVSILYLLTIFALLIAALLWAFVRKPNLQARFDTDSNGAALVTSRIRLKSDKPLWSSSAGKSLTLSPEAKGTWKPIRKLWLIPITNEYVFESDAPLSAETTYTINTSNLRDIFDTPSKDKEETFTTAALPAVVDSVASEDKPTIDSEVVKSSTDNKDWLTTAQLIITFSPAAGAEGVALNRPVTLTFPAAIKPETVDYRITPETKVQELWSKAGDVLTLTPDPTWHPETLYMVRLPGSAQTTLGQTIEREYALQFTTSAAGETETLPADNETATPEAPEEEEAPPPSDENKPVTTPVVPPVETTPPTTTTKDDNESTVMLSPKLTRNSAFETALINALKSKGTVELISESKANDVATAYCSDLAEQGYRSGHVDSAGRDLPTRLGAEGIQTDTYVETLYIDYQFDATDVANRWVTRDRQITAGRWNIGLCVGQHTAGGVIAVMVFVPPK